MGQWGKKGRGRVGIGERGAFEEDGCRFADLEKVHIVAVQVRGVIRGGGEGGGRKCEGCRKRDVGQGGAFGRMAAGLLTWRRRTLWQA